MIANRRLTAPDWQQDVRHIEFDLGDSNLTYQPGDVLYVLPQNIDENVDLFFKHSKLDPAAVITAIMPNRPELKAPNVQLPCTLRDLVKRHLDIVSYPRRYFFEVLSHFASNERERERLQEFASSEGQDEWIDYCVRPKRSVAEVLLDFPSVNFPGEYLLDLLPTVKARAFSISSSPSAHPNQAHITMAVVHYKTILQKPRQGLCTSYLASLDPQKEEIRVPVWIQRGTMRPPRDPSVPIVMVGPGTGLAIFKAFLEERQVMLRKNKTKAGEEAKTGSTTFYFGCRHRAKDYLYGELWERMVEQGTLVNYHVAFSRDQQHKVYVQHLMEANAHELWRVLGQQKGIFYLSGSARRMPIDVRDALKKAMEIATGATAEEAEAWLQQLRQEGRYLEEVWF
ncbi:NADPH-dependent diflavin oxidoreductase 1 [Balamuthia mandrillaris]